MEELLKNFTEWVKDCEGDLFYIFDEIDEAIEKFIPKR